MKKIEQRCTEEMEESVHGRITKSQFAKGSNYIQASAAHTLQMGEAVNEC